MYMKSRRSFLHDGLTATTATLLAGKTTPLNYIASASSGQKNVEINGIPVESPYEPILDAFTHSPLVALGENHTLQEMHDFRVALLHHPQFSEKVNDIVVEFGNAFYQDMVDRFLLSLQPIASADVKQIWRTDLGGSLYWDAPMYEEFFYTVRGLNWMLPAERRIRVLLGDPPVDMSKVQTVADKDYLLAHATHRDAHYADVVDREVMQKRRKALLIAGAEHLRRGVFSNEGPNVLNAASLLEQKYPGTLFVVDPLVIPASNSLNQRAGLARWQRPGLSFLKQSWLGDETQIDTRAINPHARYKDLADAVLFVGTADVLTGSRPEPAIYLAGDYKALLDRLSPIVSAVAGYSIDLAADGFHIAQSGPSFFSIFGGS